MKLRSNKQLKENDDKKENEKDPRPNPTVQKSNRKPHQNDRTQQLLKELFENFDSRVSYTRALKSFIERNEIYSKFKPVRRKFKRRATIVNGPFNTYQIDLSDYRNIKYSNSNFGWILFIIDAFSRYGYCIPLKYKSGPIVEEAIEKWLKSLDHLPKFIYSDQGTEFTGSLVQKLFKRRGIEHFVLKGNHKASIVERFQRTIKSNLEMIFYKQKKKRWVDVINKVVDNYNHRFHRSIQMSPAEVNYDNFPEVYKTLYSKTFIRRPCKLNVGDLVRIALKKKEFSKGYHQTFSNEVHKIVKAIDYRGVCVYTVQNLTGGPFLKKYYEELSLVIPNDANSFRSNDNKRKRRNSD